MKARWLYDMPKPVKGIGYKGTAPAGEQSLEEASETLKHQPGVCQTAADLVFESDGSDLCF